MKTKKEIESKEEELLAAMYVAAESGDTLTALRAASKRHALRWVDDKEATL